MTVAILNEKTGILRKTLKRVYSRIGATKYSVLKDNCGHFVFWCKTENAEFTQVKLKAGYLIATGVSLSGIAENKNEFIGCLAG